MKMLFASPDGPEVGLLRSALNQAGIPSEIRSENGDSNFPEAPLPPELWIIRDDDFKRAAAVRDDWLKSLPGALGTWACHFCGEISDGQFGACWNCGTEPFVGFEADGASMVQPREE